MAIGVVDHPLSVDRALTTAAMDWPVRRISLALWLLSALILGCGYARDLASIGSGMPIERFGWNLVWLDAEANLPAWYSSLLLLAASGLSFIAFQAQRNAKRDYGWLILCLGFLLMSVDETAQLHDILTPIARQWFESRDLLTFGWVVFVGPLAIAIAVYFIPFFLRLPFGTRLLFVVSGLLYVSGAVGMEMISGRMMTASWWDRRTTSLQCSSKNPSSSSASRFSSPPSSAI